MANQNPLGGGIMAPTFYQQMADQGNSLLNEMGVPSYKSMQNPMTGPVGGAVGALANMGPTPAVSSAGDNIARVAQGLMANRMQNLQFQQNQAMMPMMLAQQVAQTRASMAPEALQDKYGNFYYRDRMTGQLHPAASAGGLFNKGINDTNARGDLETRIFSSIPDITDNEKAAVRGHLDLIGGELDPEKRAEAIAGIPGVILNERNSAGRLLVQQQGLQERQRQDAIRNQNESTRIGLLQQRLGMSKDKMQAEGQIKMFQYGINPYTGETLSRANAPAGMLADDQGNPIPNAFAQNTRPTTEARNKGEQAQVIRIAGDTLVSHIAQVRDQLGPVMGRYNSLLDFLGNPPPEYKGLKAELESWIALHPAAHGMRGLRAVEEFQRTFGQSFNTPDSLIAGIQGAYNTMSALQQVGTPKTIPPKASATPNYNPTLPPGMGPNDPYAQFLRK